MVTHRQLAGAPMGAARGGGRMASQVAPDDVPTLGAGSRSDTGYATPRSSRNCFLALVESRNPPILHRKETFVAEDHPLRPKFARLTAAELSKGLFEESSRIGTRHGWEQALIEKGLILRGHRLIAHR